MVWAGGSQVCKSSSIKNLTKDSSIVCGEYGMGGSTTYEVKTYRSEADVLGKVMLHVDTIGLGDNRLKYDDRALLEIIECQVVKEATSLKTSTISALILVESSSDSAYKLPIVIKFLTAMFGGEVGPSCVVLLTKKNQASPAFYARRR